MLGLGWTEMLVIGVVALIFIGPKDLPVVMGRIGKVIGQIRRMGNEFQREINRSTGLDEVRSLRNSITSPLKKTADEIRKEFNTIGKDGQQSPSGALKPTDPKVESVADAIKEQAGMTPVKSSTELATDYGFKPTAAKPPASAKATPAGSKAAPAKSAPKKAAKPKTAAKPKAEAAPKAVAAPKPAEAKPAASKKPAAAKAPTLSSVEKPAKATKAASKPKATPTNAASNATSAAAAAPKPTAKPRASRKKPADTAGKN